MLRRILQGALVATLLVAIVVAIMAPGAFCPPDPTDLPPRATLEHPNFCVVYHNIFGNPAEWPIVRWPIFDPLVGLVTPA
jgi:hypothetical protein